MRTYTEHGLSGTLSYIKWHSMIGRCRPSAKGKHRTNYVLRGITVSERWKQFANFVKDMGECPVGMELDRIDNSLGYFKENCRWVTRAQNQLNKTNLRLISHNGKTQHIRAWARETGRHPATLQYRLNSGWTVSEAFETKGRIL